MTCDIVIFIYNLKYDVKKLGLITIVILWFNILYLVPTHLELIVIPIIIYFYELSLEQIFLKYSLIYICTLLLY